MRHPRARPVAGAPVAYAVWQVVASLAGEAGDDQEGPAHDHVTPSRRHRRRHRPRTVRSRRRPDDLGCRAPGTGRLPGVRPVRRVAAHRHQRGDRRHHRARAAPRGLPPHLARPHLPLLRPGHRLAALGVDRRGLGCARQRAAARGVRDLRTRGRALPRRVPVERRHPRVAAVGARRAHHRPARQRPADRGDPGAAGREESPGDRPGDLRGDRRQRPRRERPGRVRRHRPQPGAGDLRARRPRVRDRPGGDLLPDGHRPGRPARRAAGRQPRGRPHPAGLPEHVRPVPPRPPRRQRQLREGLRRRPRARCASS